MRLISHLFYFRPSTSSVHRILTNNPESQLRLTLLIKFRKRQINVEITKMASESTSDEPKPKEKTAEFNEFYKEVS